MAYALSAQLLTTEINIELGNLNATVSIFLPAVNTPNGQDLSAALMRSLATNGVSTTSGVANLQTVQDAAITALLTAPNTNDDCGDLDNTGSAETRFEKALKDVLAGVNANQDIFITL
jgi:hypothetical protein